MRTSQNTKKKTAKARIRKKRIFQKRMQERLAITVAVISLALFALTALLFRIVDEDGDKYEKQVLSQQDYDSRVIPARRGDIIDRNGTYLATSEVVYNLILDPKQIMSDEEHYLEPSVEALAVQFGYDRDEMRTYIRENKDRPYIRYERMLSQDVKDAFEAYEKETNAAFRKEKDLNESQKRVKGVWFEKEYHRTYPYNSLGCNIIGFSNHDGDSGTGGIEQQYNSSLVGTNGREYGYLNEESNVERVIKSASNGHTIVSTMDVNIQKIMEKYINEWQTTTGSKTTAAIAMDPNNGEILAMASNRQFDLNNPRDLTVMYTQEEVAAMTNEEKSAAWNTLWRNYCVSDSYEPGSPIKPFTIAAALEEGIITGNESYVCDGYQMIGGHRIRCVNRYGHGPLTVKESLMVSCNDVLMQIAAQEGKHIFSDYQTRFGFGQKTGIDLPGEADTSALRYYEDKMGPVELATNCFGQSFNVTMVQMAAAFSSLINGGTYYEPHVVKQILNSKGAVVENLDTLPVRETVSESTSAFIRDALYKTVYDPQKGTGKAAKIEGYQLGGKTGTAQKLPRGNRKYLVSFLGFAPIDNPQIVLYVVVDEPNVEDQAHSTFAAEIFRKIMVEILPYMNIFPENDDGYIVPITPSKPEGETGDTQTGETQEGAEETTAAQGETPSAEETKTPLEEDEHVIGEDDDMGLLDNPFASQAESEKAEETLAEQEREPAVIDPNDYPSRTTQAQTDAGVQTESLEQTTAQTDAVTPIQPSQAQ